MTQYDKNCENFLTYMTAVKNVAQDVIHAYDTADEDANVAWEIIEDIMQGLIAVYLDTFRWNDGKSEDLIHKNLTESDMERDIDSLEERVDEIDDRLKATEEKIEALEKTKHNIIMVDDHMPFLVNGTWTNADTLGHTLTATPNTEELKGGGAGR